MSARIKILSAIIALLCAAGIPARSQWAVLPDMAAHSLISPESLRDDISFLSDTLCKGRGVGTAGHNDAALWIRRQFLGAGLVPMGPSMALSFSAEGYSCRNIVAMLPASVPSSRYIIVMAHYDNLGTLSGRNYPGADSNASGVVALKDLARMLAYFKSNGGTLNQNIIFAALDAKQLSLAGSRDLCGRIASGLLKDPQSGRVIRPSNISMVVNLDILGGISTPLSKERVDFIIMLGGGKYNGLLQSVNIHDGINLEVGLDYYGSPAFTDLFLKRVSDQKPFLEKGMYSVMFTSGITMDTNRESDTPEKLDYLVMERRVQLIFHWIERMSVRKP